MTKNTNYWNKWANLSPEASATFETLSNLTGEATVVPLQTLPSGQQKMNGLRSAQWSGYCGDTNVAGGVTGLGEIVLTRIDGDVSKTYVHPIAKSGESLLIGAEFKKHDRHHAPVANPASPGEVFGNLRWPGPKVTTVNYYPAVDESGNATAGG